MLHIERNEWQTEAEWALLPMQQQPTACPRCAGYLLNDQDAAVLWRCVNCGCRGEGYLVFGTLTGFDARQSQGPITITYKQGCINHDDETDDAEAE